MHILFLVIVRFCVGKYTEHRKRRDQSAKSNQIERNKSEPYCINIHRIIISYIQIITSYRIKCDIRGAVSVK